MIWCYLLLFIIIYIIFNYIYIKEPICVRDDGKSHVRGDKVTLSIDSDVLDPCRVVANTTESEECIGEGTRQAQCAFYDDPETRLPDFTAELNQEESDLTLSDYICKRMNMEKGIEEEVDCSILENLTRLHTSDRSPPIYKDDEDNRYVPIPKDHLIFSSCALLNNIRSKSINGEVGHGVSLLEEIGYGCESSASTEEEERDKKRNCSIYNWCLYELNDSNFFAMDELCKSNKLKNNNGVCERCEPEGIWSDQENGCVNIEDHEIVGGGCLENQYLKRSIIVIHNRIVEFTLRFIFKLTSPVAPIYLVYSIADGIKLNNYRANLINHIFQFRNCFNFSKQTTN